MNSEVRGAVPALTQTRDGFVVTLQIDRPPFNYFDVDLIRRLAESLETLDDDSQCRAIVLAAAGRAFCAGADFQSDTRERDPSELYAQAMRLFRTRKPIVAAIQGAAIGGGLGLALIADFRVACPDARFSANFNRLGIHPGFGLTVTLPRLIGEQNAALLFYTGRRIDGVKALEFGLVDELAPVDEVRGRAQALAQELAASAPLAVASTRAALRDRLADKVLAANQCEMVLQAGQFRTADFYEGVAAATERRQPVFVGN